MGAAACMATVSRVTMRPAAARRPREAGWAYRPSWNRRATTHTATAPVTCRSTSARWHAEEVLGVAERALGHDQHRQLRRPAEHDPGRPRAHEHDQRDHGEGQEGPDRQAVDPGHGLELEGQPLDVLVAGVRTGAGDDRAGDDARTRRRDQRPPEGLHGRRRSARRPGCRRGRPGRAGRRRSRQGHADSRKWAITNGGHRFGNSTTMPPSTISPTSPATSPSDQMMRSRRRGTRTRAPSTATATATEMRPVKSRLSCSTCGWNEARATKWFLVQFGQSDASEPGVGQPNGGAGDHDGAHRNERHQR